MSEIPAMKDPMGAYWNQPPRRAIETDGTHAMMSEKTFNLMAEYSTSLPSGVYEGKMWKAKGVNGKWYLRWYGPSPVPDNCSVNAREILLV
jgi:hypothetical protein